MILDSYEKIKNIARSVCEKQGCLLYDLEFQSGSKGQGRKLLVYVDKKTGVSLEDCEKVSREVGDLLDQESLVFDGDYILEVSSPGLDRPLREKWHFDLVVGSKVFVHSLVSLVPDSEPVPRFKVTGVLESVGDHSISVAVDGKMFVIQIKDIKKSNVIFNYDSIKESKDQ